jgi:cell shape-determining protein MreC
MIFRPNIRARNKRKKILIAALIVLFLVILIFRDFSFKIVSRPALFIMRPIFSMKAGLNGWWKGLKTVFHEKKQIQEENAGLREKIMQLESEISLIQIQGKENELLKNAFSAWERENFMLSYIVSRPPQTPYDMFIIDAGSENGVKEGMQVSGFGRVLLGYVADVFPKMSKVKLISSLGEETNVLLEFSGISAIAAGRGGENFEIMLPRAVKVEIGEKILALGRQLMLVGIVEKIEHQSADPFQKILFRLPVNIQYLNQVFLLKK